MKNTHTTDTNFLIQIIAISPLKKGPKRKSLLLTPSMNPPPHKKRFSSILTKEEGNSDNSSDEEGVQGRAGSQKD